MAYCSGFFPTTWDLPVPQPTRTVAKHPRSEAEGGTLISVIQYTAFGEIRSTQGVTPTKYRYTGQLAQAELGLDYYISRWYDPVLGHFTQADTVVPEPGKASAFDRYAYVQNNPLRYNDPSGHKEAGECGDGGGGKCRKNKKIVDPPKPPEPHCKVGEDCQTQTPTATSTTTPFRFQLNTLFAPGSTPTPKTLLNSGPTSTTTKTPIPNAIDPKQKAWRIEIDPNYDRFDLSVDLIGLIADAVTLGSFWVGQPEIAAVAASFGIASEGVGVAKAVIDLVQYDPQNATQFLLKIDAIHLTKIHRSMNKMTPFIGSISSILSIGTNLKPHPVYE